MRLALAVLAALVAAAVPSAVAAPADSPRELRFKLADAIADEKRALVLLRKKPPRPRTARRAVVRSKETLDGMRGIVSEEFWTHVQEASRLDGNALGLHDDPAGMIFYVEAAMNRKEPAMALLRQPATAQGQQCGDGKDNDGDGLVDARFDSGCTEKGDATEQSALTCSLELNADGLSGTVSGTCTGSFSTLQINAPSGAAFNTKRASMVAFSEACHYASPRKLECAMKDGLANPRHVVNARFALTKAPESGVRTLLRDFAGRGRAQMLTPLQRLALRLRYYHFPLSHVCALFEASTEGSVVWSATGPNGFSNSGTVELKQTSQGKASGEASFRVFQLGTYQVMGSATIGGEPVMTTQTIAVTNDPGNSSCT